MSLDKGRNIVAIEVAGYNINSYYLLDQTSFLQAEVTAGDNIIAATGPASDSFEAIEIGERLQKVQRYSFQRTFVEVYRLENGFDLWKKYDNSGIEKIQLSVTSENGCRNYIHRNVEYPVFAVRRPAFEIIQGTFRKVENAKEYNRDRALVNIGAAFRGYYENELECHLSKELDELETCTCDKKSTSYNNIKDRKICSNNFIIYDFGTNMTGFIALELECTENTLLYATFDEVLINGDLNYKRNASVNGVKYELKPGLYNIETMEPYTLKFLKLAVLEGCVTIKGIYVREYAGNVTGTAEFNSSSDELNRIFKAGVETFRQNAIDVFMDCPSR